MKSLLKDVQIVFHLACLGVRQSIHDPIENNEVNATATLDLLNICSQLIWKDSFMSRLQKSMGQPCAFQWMKILQLFLIQSMDHLN